jgi:hypothetical protein
VRVFVQCFALEDAFGSHDCWLEASMHMTDSMPLERPLLLTVATKLRRNIEGGERRYYSVAGMEHNGLGVLGR